MEHLGRNVSNYFMFDERPQCGGQVINPQLVLAPISLLITFLHAKIFDLCGGISQIRDFYIPSLPPRKNTRTPVNFSYMI